MNTAVSPSNDTVAEDLASAQEQMHTGSRRFEILEKNLRRQTGKAVIDFNMIEEGDRVMVCLSGGADSYTMLETLRYLQKVAPISFELFAVNLDQKQPGFPEEVLPRYLDSIAMPYRIVEEDTYSIVKEKVAPGKTTCSLCSRLRRGILYRTAREIGATKIALGHHRDDILHTFMLNLFYGGTVKTMPPKLRADDGENVVIRPLAYVAEADLARWAAHKRFPIIPCNLCGSQSHLQRVKVGQMLRDWEREQPGRTDRIFRAMGDIVPSHLMDRRLYPFQALRATGVADAAGDRAFDDDDGCAAPAPAAAPITLHPMR